MPKQFLLLVALYLSLTNHISAQDAGVLNFAIKYQPNTTYLLANTSKSITKIELTGLTPEAKAKLLAKAGKPTLTVANKDMTARIITGPADGNADYPVKFVLDKAINSQETDGKPAVQSNPLQNLTLLGKAIAGTKIQLDSVSGDKIPANFRQVFINTFNSTLAQIQLPNQTLKVGGSFVQDNTVSLPIGDVNMQMVMKIRYTLQKIADGLAHITIETTANFKYEKEGMADLKAQGGGTGKMIYNIKNEYPDLTENSLTIKLSKEANGVNTTIEITQQSLKRATLTRN